MASFSASIRALLRASFALGLVATATGCGATGLAWVTESGFSGQSVEPVSLAGSEPRQGRPDALPPTTEQALISGGRPRLSHTVTLGEIAEATPRASDAAPAVTSVTTSVTVNNYQIVGSSGAGFGYASFGYGRSQPTIYTGRAPSPLRSGAAGPQAGQDWPAITEHGSSFPLRSAPASPWARTR